MDMEDMYGQMAKAMTASGLKDKRYFNFINADFFNLLNL